MVESSMYIGIGFLLGVLTGLLFIQPTHNRAVRLTTKRLTACLPETVTELRAAKDLMRAEFALSTRRLELQIEDLRARRTGHFAQLAGKDDKIKQYEIQIAALRVRLAALQGRTKPARDAEIRSRSEAA
jgi:hypothetical protein